MAGNKYFNPDTNGPKSKNWLKEIVRPLRRSYFELILLSAAVNIIALAVPVFVLQVYDRVVFHAGVSTLQGLVIGLCIALLFDFILRQARSRLLQRTAMRIDIGFGKALFAKLTSLTLRDLERVATGQYVSLFRDADVIRNTYSGASALLLVDLPFVVLFAIAIFLIAEPVAWVVAILIPIFLVVSALSATRIGAANQQERQALLDRDARVHEIIAGRNTLKALALDEALRPEWDDLHAQAIESSLRRGARADTFVNIGTGLAMFSTVAVTTVGALAIIEQQLTIGALIAANILVGRIVGPMNQLLGNWRNFANHRGAMQRLNEFLALRGETNRDEVDLGRARGDIDLETASFSFGPSERKVLNNVSLSFRPGGLTVILGNNGSGKTTLLKLARGLYPPDKGRVLLDGADTSQFSNRTLARNIGYVPQELQLFAASIRYNIAIADPEASDDRIVRAAQLAGIHQQIIDLPDGYDTDIGEHGNRLSGGQRQRIAIARAMLRDPPVLLLDEPTVGLDRDAEMALLAVLVPMAKERTVVVASHSQMVVSNSNRVVVLAGGRVVANGPTADVARQLNQQTASPVNTAPTEE